jgi:hypothetical protein
MKSTRFLPIISAGFLFGCAGHGPDIQIVVPDGYRGLVQIQEVSSAEEMSLVDGTYRIEVPENGVVQVKSVEPFGKWQRTKVFFANGMELNDASFEEMPGEVQWWDRGRQGAPTGPNEPPASVDLFVGTREELEVYVKGVESRFQAMDVITSLGNPANCLSANDSAPCRRMFDALVGISKLDTVQLKALYAHFDERRSLEQSDRIDNLLRILTRVAIQVEVIKERKRFINRLDDGARPKDWMYPVGFKHGRFVLLGSGFKGHSTGVLQSPKAEFDYVTKKAPRRLAFDTNAPMGDPVEPSRRIGFHRQ